MPDNLVKGDPSKIDLLIPNADQAMVFVRWAINAGGASLAGFVVGKGWASAETVLSLLNSQAFIFGATSVVMLVWALFQRTRAKTIALADSNPAVKGVIMMPTDEGKALAKSIPSPTVVAAGTAAADVVASRSPTVEKAKVTP